MNEMSGEVPIGENEMEQGGKGIPSREKKKCF